VTAAAVASTAAPFLAVAVAVFAPVLQIEFAQLLAPQKAMRCPMLDTVVNSKDCRCNGNKKGEDARCFEPQKAMRSLTLVMKM
jgi:hypothetical protein